MASVPDRNYFPPLDESLFGDRVLLSWKHVATALSDPSGQRQTAPAVIDFFDDEYVHGILRDPASVFASPSDATKKVFETKTAPVNTTPASNDRVDIKTIKEDSEWLSKNANISLVAALRIVVVEFQSRPAHCLAGPLSSQDATNLQEAAGFNNGQATSFLSAFGATQASDADEILADFEKPEAKKRRLFRTYLSERRHFMMVVDYTTSIALYGRLPVFTRVDRNLAQLYRFKTSADSQQKDKIETLLPIYLKSLIECMGLVESGYSSVAKEDDLLDEMIELEWLRAMLTEVVHTMSVIFQLADSLGDTYAPLDVISDWFGFMEAYCFFDRMQLASLGMAELVLPLKTLAAVISYTFLRPVNTITFLANQNQDTTPVEDIHDSYIFSEVVEQIHRCIIAAAEADSEAGSPVIFTWSVIFHQMEMSLRGRNHTRDERVEQTNRYAFEAKSEFAQSPASIDVAVPTLTRRNSTGSTFSIEHSKFDSFVLSAIESESKELGPPLGERLAVGVTAGGRVHDIISRMASDTSLPPLIRSRINSRFLGLLKVTFAVVGYRSEPVMSLLSLLLTDRDYWDITNQQTLSPEHDVRANMLKDTHLLELYLEQSLDRYPYELMPFLRLCRSLCTVTDLGDHEHSDLIMNVLRNTPSLSLVVPPSFVHYEMVEDDDPFGNTFELTADIPLISLSPSWKRRILEDDVYRVPAGTLGRFLTNESESQSDRVVKIDFVHSTLSLLGRRLEINMMPEGYQTEMGLLQSDEVAEIIMLFATLIRVDFMKSSGSTSNLSLIQQDSDIISEASKHISGGKDLVTVVCDVMDYYLQEGLTVDEEAAVFVLNACVQFLNAVSLIHPSRVWSYLARSDLLNSDSKAGRLTSITGTLDLIASRFDFLDSSVQMFSQLIDTAMASAVQRRAKNKVATRQKTDPNPLIGIASKVLSRVSRSIAQACVDIFETTSTWRFESEDKRISLLNHVLPIFNKLISYCFSMGDPQSSENLTSNLRPAALHILDCFIQPTTGTLRFQPILSSFTTALTISTSTLYPQLNQTLYNQVTSVLDFATNLLRVSTLLEKPSSMIENYLFKSCTLLARLSATSDYLCGPAIRLLEGLVINAGKSENEPVSLLGYLGPQTSKSFLQLLSSLGEPFLLPRDVKLIWRFFSSVLRNRQQWISSCLLTGQTPREVMKKTSKNEVASHSVFATALKKVSKLKTLDTDQALVVLDFLASAQNFWPWTVFTSQKDTSYLDGLREYVRDLRPSHLVAKSNATQAATEARIAAYIGETFAMQLYHSRHLGNADSLAKKLVADLDYYLRDGVEVSGYNKSLHSNFAKNFSDKYSGCSLDDFKRTLLEPRDLGVNYYYDLDRANGMLSFDPGWLGRKDNGFKMEMELANTNLSLVDAQIALFHAWEFLLVELSICLPTNDTIAKQMLQTAQQCLNANQGILGPEAIFLKLADARSGLALVLIQRLVRTPLASTDIDQLLETVVATINGVDDPFSTENIPYYRTLLKALFVTLRAYQLGGRKSSDSDSNACETSVLVTQTVLNILDRVVGQGFRSLVSLIHDNAATVLPEDLGLITAILQACLSLPGIDQSQTQILNIIASHNCVYAATSLYSWADKLADQGDPIYGELSILFLLELSTLPLLAEQMACDGVLSSLLSANLTKFMLKSHLSPYADLPVIQRCYCIWAKGLLPLLLNWLAALGATVAPEVAFVLNQFKHLLKLSVERFDVPGTSRTQSRSTPHFLTLIATTEIHSLALLVKVISALRINNTRDIPEVEWDATSLLENVEFWLASDRLLKERLLPLGTRETEWRGMKPSAGEPHDNVLEARLCAQLQAVRDVLGEDAETE
ncbi:unnamed protein product [Clonostachys solani]|uniref:Nucleoporin n=1 Tax=Clonostachys solani TaxID=160281 RepID=A0A9N9W7U2_9HYPO|nr:unnamed protein product [Clonostachys solani]